jgi:RNA 2',3'-cyclic 3'-phosphodiesterase
VRLFVAITPPQAALGDLDAAVAPLRPVRPELRWTSRQSWHITLAFLGEVDGEVTDRLAVRLERAAGRHPGPSLELAGAGAFPAAARARVLWTGIQGDRAGLTRIAASVAAGARRAGAPAPDEGRRYRPHITLARCPAPADVRPLVTALAGYPGPPWTAGRIHLMRSHPGSVYESIGSWPLRPPAPAA